MLLEGKGAGWALQRRRMACCGWRCSRRFPPRCSPSLASGSRCGRLVLMQAGTRVDDLAV